MNVAGILADLEIGPVNSGACGVDWIGNPSGGELASLNPATGAEIARVSMAGAGEYDRIVGEAVEAFGRWRLVPAPKRGQIVREIGDELRARKAELGALVTLESGKILATLYQRPFTQGKVALETLTRYLVDGVKPEPVTRLAPHIILRSNLPLFLNRLTPSSESEADDK